MTREHLNIEDITTTGSICETEWCDDCGAYRHVTGKDEYDEWHLPENSGELEKAREENESLRLATKAMQSAFAPEETGAEK